MVCRRWSCFAAGLVLVCVGNPALGGEYTDPSGFSFTYPDDWVVVTREILADARKQVGPDVKDWLAKTNMDLNRIRVAVFRKGHDENLNVIVNDKELPVNDRSVQELRNVLPQQFKTAGFQADNLQVGIQKIGPHEVAVSDFQVRLPVSPDLFREKQVYLPGGGKTFIITCTAKANSFQQVAPAFEQILASFRVPPPTPGGFDWKGVMITGLIGGVAGGLIGGAFALYKKLAARRK